jgi:hypothetical protein
MEGPLNACGFPFASVIMCISSVRRYLGILRVCFKFKDPNVGLLSDMTSEVTSEVMTMVLMGFQRNDKDKREFISLA